MEQRHGIFKKTLSNGLVVLVRPMTHIPKVSLQLCYHVGSKDEASGEKGLAHLVEHMIFKGTQTLSETDIAALTQKLSGSTNAFTNYDYTSYLFDFPSHHWKEALAIYADSMRNSRFEEQMLNSELKAVIQELKMRRDNYFIAVWQSLFSAVFVDHPYHYPIIGFKQDLWSLKRDDLFNFYRKHYIPNNAALVVVGDVVPEEVFAEAEKTVGQIPSDPFYTRKEFYCGKDLVAQSAVVYRDVKQPYGLFSFVIPGAKTQNRMVFETLSALLGQKKSSRLTKKIVHDLRLATEFSSFVTTLEDASLFSFFLTVNDEKNIEEIRSIIAAEIDEIIEKGISKQELAIAVKQIKTTILTMLESNMGQAQLIGESYTLTGNAHERFEMLEFDDPQLDEKIRTLVKDYFSPAVMHVGKVLPLSEQDKEQWKKLQELSDAEDARILNGRTRELPVEPTRYTDGITLQEAKDFHFARPDRYTLSNGIEVLAHSNKNMPKIDLVLNFYAEPHFDSEELPGLYGFVCQMLKEGTKNYPGHSFAKVLDDSAISFSAYPGGLVLRFLKEDTQLALALLKEALTQATFEPAAIEKTRDAMLSQLKYLSDEPSFVSMQALKELFFAGHPYSKKMMGTEESLQAITRDDLEEFYRSHLSLDKARIAIVGDLEGYTIKNLLEEAVGTIPACKVRDEVFPELMPVESQVITKHMNRDQVVLMFACRSVTRSHPDYSKLALFDRMLAGSMDSRLFKLRQRTGLFYSISGTLVADSDEQPGLVLITTMVSLDRLEEAKKVIRETLETVIDDITQEELAMAKRAALAGRLNSYSLNISIAGTFLYLDKFGLGDDFYDTMPARLDVITLDDVKTAAKKVLVPEKMVTLQCGRFE